MKPQSAKAKGRRLQQIVVNDLLAAFPHLQPDDITSTSMGANGEDIQMSALARQSIPLSIEAKNQERLNIWSAIEQAKSNCPQNAQEAVVFKKNNSPIYACVRWDTLLKLMNHEKSENAATIKKIHDAIQELTKCVSELS